MNAKLISPPQRAAHNLTEFSERYGVAEATLRKEIVAGRLVARKVGALTVITADAEKDWLNALPKYPSRAL